MSLERFLERGIKALKKHEHKTADQFFQQALKKDPTHFKTLYYYARSLRFQQNYQEALKILDKALQSNPNSIEAILEKGLCYQLMSFYVRAIKYFNQVLAKDPMNLDALYNKGQANLSLGFFSDMRDCYQQMLLYYPDFVPGRCYFAWSLRFNNDVAANQEFKRAIECIDSTQPNKFFVLATAGLLMSHPEQLEQEQRRFEIIKTLKNMLPHQLSLIADYEEKHLENKTDTPREDYLLFFSAFSRLADWDQAEVNYILGIAHRKIKKYKLAIEYFNKILPDLTQNDVAIFVDESMQAYFHLVFTYIELKKKEQAIKTLILAIDHCEHNNEDALFMLKELQSKLALTPPTARSPSGQRSHEDQNVPRPMLAWAATPAREQSHEKKLETVSDVTFPPDSSLETTERNRIQTPASPIVRVRSLSSSNNQSRTSSLNEEAKVMSSLSSPRLFRPENKPVPVKKSGTRCVIL